MPELYDLCDEMGFLVMDEAFDEWEGPKTNGLPVIMFILQSIRILQVLSSVPERRSVCYGIARPKSSKCNSLEHWK